MRAELARLRGTASVLFCGGGTLKGTTDTVAGSRSKSRNSRPLGHGFSWYITVPSSRKHL